MTITAEPTKIEISFSKEVELSIQQLAYTVTNIAQTTLEAFSGLDERLQKLEEESRNRAAMFHG